MGLREFLKAGTADLHTQIEMGSRMTRLMAPDLREEEYAQYLRHMLKFHSFVEEKIREIPEVEKVIDDCPQRLRSASLKRDLQSLNCDIDRSPSLYHLSIRNLSQAIGVMYVLEGSSLGAQVIAKQLERHPFIDSERLNYFRHYGPNLGKFWQRFIQNMESAYSRNELDSEQVLAAARATFQTLNS